MKPRNSSSRASTSLPCIDSHCHLDRLLGKMRFWGTLVQFLEQNGETDHLQACITNFCDPKLYTTRHDVVSSIAAFGCHPRKLHQCTPRAKHALRRYLSHTRTHTLGEIGLDYDNSTITSHQVMEQCIMLTRLSCTWPWNTENLSSFTAGRLTSIYYQFC